MLNRGIDHLVLGVHNLVRAREVYESLGFTVTPRAVHSWGTANALVQLQGNFLEILAVDSPEKIPAEKAGHFSFGAFNQTFLRSREGMSMLVFQSDDARRDHREFAASGVGHHAPFDFSRQAKLPDGSTAEVSFSLAFATDERMPEAAFFVCQQHAPEYFWRPEYQRHPNGATGVSEVVMRAAQPASLADFFAKLQGSEAISIHGDSIKVDTALGSMAVLTPSAFDARFPEMGSAFLPDTPVFAAYRVTVTDLEQTERHLRSSPLAFQMRDGNLQVAATDAFGVVIEFSTI